MKKQWLLLPFILLGACRTPAGTKEYKKMANPAAVTAEKLLRKVVGGMPDEKSDQHFDCSVMSTDVADVAQVKKWIAEIPKNTSIGYHIVAQIPSIQLFAYEGSTEIVIVKDHSTIELPQNPSASAQTAIKELTQLIDKKCPTPAKN